MTLISRIPDQKLQSVSAPGQGGSALRSHHNLHLHPWPNNSNSQAYFRHSLEWALHKSSNLPPSLLTFSRRPSILSQAVSLLNLILRCWKTHASMNDFPGLSTLISFKFRGQTISQCSHTLSQEKTHIDSINRWLSAFEVYCTVLLTSFPHRAGVMFVY